MENEKSLKVELDIEFMLIADGKANVTDLIMDTAEIIERLKKAYGYGHTQLEIRIR